MMGDKVAPLGALTAEATRPYTVRGGLASAAKRMERANQHAANLVLVVYEIEAGGATTFAAIAEGLNARQIGAPRGGLWSVMQVKRLKARLGEAG